MLISAVSSIFFPPPPLLPPLTERTRDRRVQESLYSTQASNHELKQLTTKFICMA